MYRLRLPMSTAHHMCEASYAIAQPKGDDLTEHYEFNWCLRSPLGGRLLMRSGTKDRNDLVKTKCKEKANCNCPLHLAHSNWNLFRQGCHHQAPGTTTGTTNFNPESATTDTCNIFLFRDASGDVSYKSRTNRSGTHRHSEVALTCK